MAYLGSFAEGKRPDLGVRGVQSVRSAIMPWCLTSFFDSYRTLALVLASASGSGLLRAVCSLDR